MKITEVELAFIKPHKGLVAFASCVIENSIYLSNIAIHKKLSSDGYSLTYPSKGPYTIFHLISKSASKQIELKIFDELKNVMKKVNTNVQEIQS